LFFASLFFVKKTLKNNCLQPCLQIYFYEKALLTVITFSNHGEGVMDAENGYEKIAMSFLNSFKLITNRRIGVTTIIGDSDSPNPAPKPKPVPPPPVITETTWKEYISEEGGFKVSVPGGQLTKTSIKKEAPFGEKTFHRHLKMSVTKNGAIFFDITHYDFPGAITDPQTIDAAYLAGRDATLQRPNMKLVNEKAVALGEFNGKEFVFEDKQTKYVIRTFIIKQRYFQLSVAAPITNKTNAPNTTPINEIAEKFFSSFAITKLPEVVEPVSLPKDFGDKLENYTYTNEFWGFSITLSKEWNIASKEEETTSIQIGKELFKNEKESVNSMMESSLNNTKILIIATKPKDNGLRSLSVIIAAEKLPFANLTSLDMALLAQKSHVKYQYLRQIR
jgi:hypothetical protein